jgi:hypothetical protein
MDFFFIACGSATIGVGIYAMWHLCLGEKF